MMTPEYVSYLKSVAMWDFGPSFKYKGQSVNDLISSGFPVSFTLGAEAILLALALGVLFGVIAALYHNKWQDYTVAILTILPSSEYMIKFHTLWKRGIKWLADRHNHNWVAWIYVEPCLGC